MEILQGCLRRQPLPRWLFPIGLALSLSGFLTHLSAAPPDLLVDSATAQVGVTTSYDGRYRTLSYPGGDVPMDRGVCTDVLIRAYRHLGIDLQQRVHQDMSVAWSAYPKLWRLKTPDRNIDHRRVPNLQTFFIRQGANLPLSREPSAYRPGDIVTWLLPQGLPHIGIIARICTPNGTPLVIHNIGQGTQVENILFRYRITGHYRYFPE